VQVAVDEGGPAGVKLFPQRVTLDSREQLDRASHASAPRPAQGWPMHVI
jgi:hypothetical protein